MLRFLSPLPAQDPLGADDDMNMSAADAVAPGGVVAAAREVCEGARQAALHACAGAQTAAQAATAAKVGNYTIQ